MVIYCHTKDLEANENREVFFLIKNSVLNFLFRQDWLL